MVKGISHITLIVKDLERTSALFKALSAQQVYDSGTHPHSLSTEQFFLLGGVWFALMEGEPLPERTYNHVALAVDEANMDELEQRLLQAGAEVLPGRPRITGEGRSLYFYDFDNHLFELHSGTLAQRLASYRALDGEEMNWNP